jgi:hypothetical protein
MLSVLTEKSIRQFYLAGASEDGVPGIVRAGTLVAFHFYVWAAFWHLGGGERTARDDAVLRRADRLLAPLRLPYRWRDRK